MKFELIVNFITYILFCKLVIAAELGTNDSTNVNPKMHNTLCNEASNVNIKSEMQSNTILIGINDKAQNSKINNAGKRKRKISEEERWQRFRSLRNNNHSQSTENLLNISKPKTCNNFNINNSLYYISPVITNHTDNKSLVANEDIQIPTLVKKDLDATDNTNILDSSEIASTSGFNMHTRSESFINKNSHKFDITFNYSKSNKEIYPNYEILEKDVIDKIYHSIIGHFYTYRKYMLDNFIDINTDILSEFYNSFKITNDSINYSSYKNLNDIYLLLNNKLSKQSNDYFKLSNSILEFKTYFIQGLLHFKLFLENIKDHIETYKSSESILNEENLYKNPTIIYNNIKPSPWKIFMGNIIQFEHYLTNEHYQLQLKLKLCIEIKKINNLKVSERSCVSNKSIIKKYFDIYSAKHNNELDL